MPYLRLLLLLALAFCSSARADMVWKDYRTLAQRDPPAADNYLDAIGSSYSWANVVLDLEHKPLLFCVPRGQMLTVESYRQAINTATKLMPEEDAALLDVTILMLKALRNVYPCNNVRPTAG